MFNLLFALCCLHCLLDFGGGYSRVVVKGYFGRELISDCDAVQGKGLYLI